MGKKAKFSFEIKIDIVLQCLKGETTAGHEAVRLGGNPSRVLEWIALYQSLGENGLITTSKNTRSSTKLRNWIMKYNGYEELKAFGIGGTIIMTKGRKTTFDERIKIVQHCISYTYN